MQTYKNKLKFWRQERGLSQYHLSLVSNVPRYIIQLVEQSIRAPNTEELKSLSSALGVEPREIFSHSVMRGTK